mgnify:CR=1 FL=1
MSPPIERKILDNGDFKDCKKNNEGSVLINNATKDSLQISINNDTLNYIFMGGYKDKTVDLLEGTHDIKVNQKSGIVGNPNFWHFIIDLNECQTKTITVD